MEAKKVIAIVFGVFVVITVVCIIVLGSIVRKQSLEISLLEANLEKSRKEIETMVKTIEGYEEVEKSYAEKEIVSKDVLSDDAVSDFNSLLQSFYK